MQKKAPWSTQFGVDDFEITRDELLCQSFYQLRELDISHRRFEGGRVAITRDLIWRPDAVCLLPYDPWRDQVVLIEQFRIGTIDHPSSPWLLELVAGMVEPNESIEDVARREAVEEAGLTVGELTHISRFSPSPGGVREYIDLFCGLIDSSSASGVHGLEEEGEDIKVHCLSRSEAMELLAQGKIDNAPAIIALQWLALNHSELQQQASAR